MRHITFTLLFGLLVSTTFASQEKAQVVIRLQAQNGNIDEATLYFDQGIHPVYVYQEDAQKVFSHVAGVPVLYSLSSDLISCSINGFGSPASSEEVALGASVDADGTYDISAPFLDNVDPTSIVRLEDRKLWVFTDLREGKYTTQLLASDSATGRFFLHISSPIKSTFTNAGCSNNDGDIAIVPDNTVSWTTCTLLDAFNNQVGAYNNINDPFDFTGLAEGDYYMVLAYGNYSTTQAFHISGHYVVSNIIASKQNVEVGEAIDFSAIATNANNFHWDFGDGTLITGVANPTINYYEPGDYVVNMTCSNDYGCTDNAQINITVTIATISGIKDTKENSTNVYAAGKQITVKLGNEVSGDAQMQVYNLIGQSVYSSSINSRSSVFGLDDQPMGCYIVSVKNAGALNTKRVFLSK